MRTCASSGIVNLIQWFLQFPTGSFLLSESEHLHFLWLPIFSHFQLMESNCFPRFNSYFEHVHFHKCSIDVPTFPNVSQDVFVTFSTFQSFPSHSPRGFKSISYKVFRSKIFHHSGRGEKLGQIVLVFNLFAIDFPIDLPPYFLP